MGINTQWIDVRNFIKTDSNYRDATVDWDLTHKNISKNVKKNIEHYPRIPLKKTHKDTD
jgi:aspartate kinase